LQVLHELKMRGKELEEQRNAAKAKVEDDELEFAAWKIKSDLYVAHRAPVPWDRFPNSDRFPDGGVQARPNALPNMRQSG
jgi:hypothetical protein